MKAIMDGWISMALTWIDVSVSVWDSRATSTISASKLRAAMIPLCRCNLQTGHAQPPAQSALLVSVCEWLNATQILLFFSFLTSDLIL
ncbi:hypothetical protein L210DRAFT_2201396 [Boletus edulis BED1]|uniref:Uncharacterized protein n=1 Tax=Boletus edulis BED1 TaxID=1328754 RepID=A0AAD4BD89_BOLED|nr:hypothetical protein L210DRAFT_2201396 [Boletus edulis BED1]